ncbi:uncharacterized protein BDZ99DRAFT_502937 [Mytilinidion resinicola]|uniref:F-box domain-containing protein n=1 Tax=Mytilinidion resinicola TaxID=574789 RepID=A0A6A6Y5A4_9PEZI|nr:uncharacterized protein BDZ99DRAFT_502937 [Mytilinidion resinicola]KAF2803703.1 hypothetical protein BDZ99DRAFT_502937 [Mytilinidion resinicola]
MASESSPPSTPRSSRSSGANTPVAYDDDLASSAPPSPEDVQLSPKVADEELEQCTTSDAPLRDLPQVDDHSAKQTLSKLLKGKEKEWTDVARKGPLRLLDLPVDILKEIIYQLPHTNDLTSLALCHSALHSLTIPCIYSRFDIVWPDESTQTEPRTGVDALTYGLATLVMAEEIFGEAPHQNNCQNCGSHVSTTHMARSAQQTPFPLTKRRRGNYYAQFTKKFSLGNGPHAWVQEYMIAKEGGKMLGTLVALAVARMKNLETFVWDMPTGVLRDVWLALSSLADRTDGEDCRLERLWIRWHDNTGDSPSPIPPPPMMLNNVPPPPNTAHPSGAGATQAPIVVPVHYSSSSAAAIDRVENPTFSVIPPLKSLSVLDIDELPYLDEMAILIARSQRGLRELRIGIARHAQQRDWVTAWDGDGIQQVDYSTTWTAASSISEKRLGGVLGTLVGRVYNMRHNDEIVAKAVKPHVSPERPVAVPEPVKTSSESNAPVNEQIAGPERDMELESEHGDGALEELSAQEGVSLVGNGSIPPIEEQNMLPANSVLEDAITGPATAPTESHPSSNIAEPAMPDPSPTIAANSSTIMNLEETHGPLLNGKLRLDTLELERVPLSVTVLLKAFDWSLLTTLTLLHCHNHEQLWKSLRRTFSPRGSQTISGSSYSNPTKAYKSSYLGRSDYALNLKKIHTNAVSPSLIAFLKETLAPNSLEVLFLQEGRSYSSTVTVETIYRGALRRHRGSLKKLMIDSSEKGPDGHTSSSSRWRRWMLNREIITFITSGRMSGLRELAVSIDYRDWHFFLQRLPFILHVRSLYIPFIADHAHGNNIEPRELAMQVLDIVHLRPEIEICYMGISVKCFEILENKSSSYDLRQESNTSSTDGPAGGAMGGAYVANDAMMSDEEDETEDEDDDDLDGPVGAAGDGDETESDASEDMHDDSDGDDSFLQDDRKGPRLRLREILFYDDKVAIFKARHGRL